MAAEEKEELTNLILFRKWRDAIRIGDDIIVTPLSLGMGGVKLSIQAPRRIRVRREEIYQEDMRDASNSAEAAGKGPCDSDYEGPDPDLQAR